MVVFNTGNRTAEPRAQRDAANKAYADAGTNAVSQREDKTSEGIAIAMAISLPNFHPGQTFVVQGVWGDFEGKNAFGVTAAGRAAVAFGW